LGIINVDSDATDQPLIIYCKVKIKGTAIPLEALQEFEACRFQDDQHIKVVRLQRYAPVLFTPQEIFLMLISVRS
jgi:hypothetical protein